MFVRCWCMCLAMRPGAKEAAQTRCFLLMPSMRALERRNNGCKGNGQNLAWDKIRRILLFDALGLSHLLRWV